MSKVKRIQVLVTIEYSVADENEGTVEGIDAESMVDNLHEAISHSRVNGELTPNNICADTLECSLHGETLIEQAADQVAPVTIDYEYSVHNLQIREVESENFPDCLFTVSHSKVDRRYTSQDCLKLDVDFRDELGLLYMALKDDVVPSTMFTDADGDEPSTIVYVGKLANGGYVSSDRCIDADGAKLYNMIRMYDKGEILNIARVEFDDNCV
jgi:hypothetical protein